MSYAYPHIAVSAFLAGTLIVGLWMGSGIKTMREYALANTVYGTGTLTVTFLATYIEAWNLIGFPSDIFTDGLTHLVPTVLCGVIFCLLVIGRYIAPRVKQFVNALTMGDLMEIFYGDYSRRLTGFLGLVYCTAATSIQILFLQHVCRLLYAESDWLLITFALIVVLYASWGGIKAVTLTDVLQFVVIVAGLALIAHIALYEAGGIPHILRSVPPEKLRLFDIGRDKAGEFGASYYSFPILIIWMLFPALPLSFPFIQRILMAPDGRKAAHMYYLSALFLVVFFLLLTAIGLAALVLYPQSTSSEIVLHFIEKLPNGAAKALIVTSLLAVIMSTIDSFLHAAGLSFTHDVLRPFLHQRVAGFNELRVVKYVTCLIGCLAIAVALMVRDIYTIAMYGMDLAGLLFTIPLIGGIMGLKTDSGDFFFSSLATLGCFCLSTVYLNEGLVIPCCILASAISFFGAHVARNKGLAKGTILAGKGTNMPSIADETLTM